MTGSFLIGIQQGGGNEPVSLGYYETEWLLCVEESADGPLEILFGLGIGSIPSCIHREGEQDHLEDILPLLAGGGADEVTPGSRGQSGGLPGKTQPRCGFAAHLGTP